MTNEHNHPDLLDEALEENSGTRAREPIALALCPTCGSIWWHETAPGSLFTFACGSCGYLL